MSAEELMAQRQMHFRWLVAAAKAEKVQTASSCKQRHHQDLLRVQNNAVHKP